MSENRLVVFPTAPGWVPRSAAAETARRTLERSCPDARSVTASSLEEIVFVDQGSNFEAVRCPRCGARLDERWWGDRMSSAAGAGFRDLDIVVPCCDAATSLAELDYDWPAGFARFRLVVDRPGRGWLTDSELDAVGVALGHAVRQVLQRR